MASKLIAVIHYLDDETAIRNAEIVFGADYEGVCLIHMRGHDHLIDAALVKIKLAFPQKIVISNRLTMPPGETVLHDAMLGLDGSWVDNPLDDPNGRLDHGLRAVRRGNPSFLFFGSVAFKTQPHDPFPERSALMAHTRGWIATTSGAGTGIAPDEDKLMRMKAALGDAPLAVASGITPENAECLCRHVDWALVATGISDDFFHFSAEKAKALRAATI